MHTQYSLLLHRNCCRTYLTWIVITFFLFTGCMGPHYVKQKVDVPESWRFPADEGNTVCNFRWWEQFHDPVLNELILLALKNNQDLQVAIARVFEFSARLGVARAPLFPEVDGNASFTRSQSSLLLPGAVATPGGSTGSSDSGLLGASSGASNGPSNGAIPRRFNEYQVFFSASWELDLWGRIRSGYVAAYADFLEQVGARRGVVLTVVSNVATAYIILTQLDAQLEISKKTLKTRLDALKLAQDRFTAGETSELEVIQADSEVEIARIRVIQFERDVLIQEDLLSVLIGENPHWIERGRPLEAMIYPVTIPAGLPSDLLIRRPDILTAENQLIATDARVSEVRALIFPQITLTGTYGNASTHLHDLLTSPAVMWDYSISLFQLIFDAGKSYYRIKEAEAVRNEALFNYRQVVLNAFRDVNDALIAYQKNRELVEEHQRQVRVLTEYLNLANLRYGEGEVDYLSVLDAERSLFDAKLQLAQAQSDSFTAVVRLYSALGGGWVIDADATAINDIYQCY